MLPAGIEAPKFTGPDTRIGVSITSGVTAGDGDVVE
jgi:hypothetical protein